MKTKTEIKSSLDVIIYLYDLHTQLYQNVIDGISDKDATNRMNTKANHVAWIAGSLVYERYELARFLGVELKPTSGELFRDHKGIQDTATYPSLKEYKKDWEKISAPLKGAILNLSEEQLEGPDPYEMPGEEMTLAEALIFNAHRESYCIGQIGLFRRLLGYEAMKYPE